MSVVFWKPEARENDSDVHWLWYAPLTSIGPAIDRCARLGVHPYGICIGKDEKTGIGLLFESEKDVMKVFNNSGIQIYADAVRYTKL
jgi:hypothetical protein